MSGQSYSPLRPMPIPVKSITNFAPPPLPPPTHITDLEDGHDAGWLFANARNHPGSAKLAPINPGSSLFGGHRRLESVCKTDRMALDELDGRQSGLPVSTSPKAHIKIEPPPAMEEGFRNSITINAPGSILKGERDFSRRSVKDSSDAYDQHLLSKIGKPLSPRQSISLGNETVAISWGFRWTNARRAVAKQLSIWRNLSWYQAVEYDHSAFLRDVYRRRGGGTTPQSEETLSLPSRSNRGSYDQGVFSDIEGDFSTDESLPSRYFNLREATPPYLDASKSGTKRRASSPPREPVQDDRHAPHVTTCNGDLSQRRTSGHPYANTLSVNGGYIQSHGTLSAASSLSLRTSGTYSSAAMSIGGSSMTSMSTFDRPSPGGLSPSSDFDALNDRPPISSTSPGGLPSHQSVRNAQVPDASELRNADSTTKLSLQTTLNVPKSAAPKMAGLYICDCCPKKPKKFDSPAELRAHEMEKQYSCQFCNNRFKNKNEAERHQNSLHLRRHSWSCAALPGYQAAFHPSTSPTAQTNSGPSHDACGYCGEEFPNFPQPDWDRRFEHLTSVHKFGECNNGKKFYRADHFRQHLKHSHAGTSGKWTNVLENACMKEEAPPELKDTTRSSGAGSAAPETTGSLTSNKISEVLSPC
ncbi:hypothetical protein KXX53_000056 [Aspergillus fumigatus]|nr:hypothetical protein KXX53_000056 [Aspergillus fumigatus]